MTTLANDPTLLRLSADAAAAQKRSDASKKAAATVKVKKEARRIASKLSFNTAPIYRPHAR